MLKKKTTKFRKWKGLCLWGIMAVTALSVKLPVSAAVTEDDLAGPVVDVESHTVTKTETTEHGHVEYRYKEGDHKSSYHYVYFGSYPQKEIKGGELTDAIRNAAYDAYGNAEVDGKRYRRITYDMTNRAGSINDTTYFRNEFNAVAENGYRYFLYEPIRWRILKKENGQLMLLSDMLLDCQVMNSGFGTNPTWENCGMRKWLNYDGSTVQNLGKMYKSPGFLYYAFDQEEQKKIQITHLEQDDNPEQTDGNGNPVSGGKDTDDKVYLLSYSDISNKEYGFCTYREIDISCTPLIAHQTQFAGAMTGRKIYEETNYTDGEQYWLRTPGKNPFYSLTCICGRTLSESGKPNNVEFIFVRPVMNVTYSLSDCIRISYVTNTPERIEDQIMLGSSCAKEPDTPAREGYEFTGWYTDAACTSRYEFNTDLKADTVLYAGWKLPEQPGNGQQTSDQPTVQPANKTFGYGGIRYRVISSKSKTVEYMGSMNAKGKKAKSITIPAAITYQGVTYKVTAVGKKACKNYKKLKKVTIGKNVIQIKAEAFRGCSKLQTVTVKTTKLKTVGKKAFYKIHKKAAFKVPKKKYKAYKKLLKKKSIGYKSSMKIKKN